MAKELTKSEIARNKRRDTALGKIKADTKEVVKLEKQIERLQDRMSKQALISRNNGARYADIGDAAGRSSAWVQQALIKAGYEPRKYTKHTKRSEDGEKK